MTNRYKKLIKRVMFMSLAILMLFFICPGCRQFENQKNVISLGNGLQIVSVESYSGAFLEDGSNENVSDILTIVLENTSGKDLQYAEILLEFKNGTATFSVTNIPDGKKVMLQELNKMAYTKKDVVSSSIANVVFLDEMQLCEDMFEITGLEGVINVRNISGKNISGDIYVYYKNIDSEKYMGGITYRVRIEGGMNAGEIRQLAAGHYDSNNSEILMVSYAQ